MTKEHRLVLGIETSCDETSVAVVDRGRTILSNVIASQVDLHARYGGVVPEIASRKHLETIVPAFDEALSTASLELGDLDAVAVTCGPGLAGALLVGIGFGKALALGADLDLIGVNHLEGHIYANMLDAQGEGPEPLFPLICMVVSGGHTDLIHIEGHGHMRILGRTRDDAAGEAFDKVARLMDLGYPGGPRVDALAKKGDPAAVRLPRAYLEEGSYDFSFSGLKTAVAHVIQGPQAPPPEDIAASFQRSVATVLTDKAFRAVRETKARMLMLAGGVSANSEIRRMFLDKGRAAGIPVHIPPPILCTDNAAMIACAGYHSLARGLRSSLELNAYPSLSLGQLPDTIGGTDAQES